MGARHQPQQPAVHLSGTRQVKEYYVTGYLVQELTDKGIFLLCGLSVVGTVRYCNVLRPANGRHIVFVTKKNLTGCRSTGTSVHLILYSIYLQNLLGCQCESG